MSSVGNVSHYENKDELYPGMNKNLRELEIDGFTIVPDVFTPEQLVQFRTDYAKVLQKAENIMNSVPAKKRDMEENDTSIESRYWKIREGAGEPVDGKPSPERLILQAGKGRFDFYKGFCTSEDGIFGTESVHRPARLKALIGHNLVKDFQNYVGFIHSTPGSDNQYWHRDTDCLSNTGTDGSKLVLIDDFYFTCIMPVLVGITMANGPTEFYAGSHRLPAADFEKCERKFAEVPLGSALVFNGKINHRGSANPSSSDRPALYSVYHKSWYNDAFRRGVD